MPVLSKPVGVSFAMAALLQAAVAINYNDTYYGAIGPGPISTFDVAPADSTNLLRLAGRIGGSGSYPLSDWTLWKDQVECVLPGQTSVTVGGLCGSEAIAQIALSAIMQVVVATEQNFGATRFHSVASNYYWAYMREDRGQGPSCPGCPGLYTLNPPPLDSSYYFRQPGFRFELKTKAIKITCKKTCNKFENLNEDNVAAVLRELAGQLRNAGGRVADIQLYRDSGNRPVIAKCRVTLLSDATPYGGRNWLGTADPSPDVVKDTGSPGQCTQP